MGFNSAFEELIQKILQKMRPVFSENLIDSSHFFSNMHHIWIITLACG